MEASLSQHLWNQKVNPMQFSSLELKRQLAGLRLSTWNPPFRDYRRITRQSSPLPSSGTCLGNGYLANPSSLCGITRPFTDVHALSRHSSRLTKSGRDRSPETRRHAAIAAPGSIGTCIIKAASNCSKRGPIASGETLSAIAKAMAIRRRPLEGEGGYHGRRAGNAEKR